MLRRKKEAADAEMAASSATAAHVAALEHRQHEAALQKVREAERMKRAEKSAWHALLVQQEGEMAGQRAAIEERKINAQVAGEQRVSEVRRGEVDYRAGVERRVIREREEAVQRQRAAGKDQKMLEWGTVD